MTFRASLNYSAFSKFTKQAFPLTLCLTNKLLGKVSLSAGLPTLLTRRLVEISKARYLEISSLEFDLCERKKSFIRIELYVLSVLQPD